MSIFGMMRTSISGMAVQADRLGAISDNVANAKTTGYKESSTEFSTLVLEAAPGQYQSGAVETHVRHLVSKQGSFEYTSSSTDLAVKGNGFFIVKGADGQNFLTRAGSFVKDANGDLVNAAGYKLLGVKAGAPDAPANGAAGLEVVNVGSQKLKAVPSTSGSLTVNLDFRASVVPAPTASANAAASVYTSKNSIITYGNKGEQVTLDVYYTKTAADTWEVAIYDQADAASTTAPFPYASGPVSTTTLNFDPANGDLVSPTSLSFAVPGGQTLNLDISKSSQLASSFAPRAVSIDGNAAADVDHVEVNDKGEIYGIYTNGARVLNFTVPLARVPSPDNLTPVSGNVFSLSGTSGDIQVGTAASLGLGTIVSSALEASTVDIASELTLMIETQRNYTANSKVFQTGAELSDVLVNLVR